MAEDTFINSGSPNANAGAHAWFDAGLDGAGGLRRGLLRFDVSSIPPGSIVTAASLQLTVVKVPGTGALDSTFDLFRLLASWKEGTKSGNAGSTATAGETTWNARLLGTANWTIPGAKQDAVATASASTAAGDEGQYSWSGSSLVADVQLWVNTPAQNFGWLLASRAESASRSVRGFAARESGAARGTLTVVYTPPIADPIPNPPTRYVQHNLVSDLAGVADHTDPNLVNPWGIAYGPTTPFWIADNWTGISTVYDGNGVQARAAVPILGAPTGIVFNPTTDFAVVPGQPAKYIFATEDGTIAAWSSGTAAVTKVDLSVLGTVYKGLALGSVGGKNYLYAASFSTGRVDVFDANFVPATVGGSFTDPNLPAGFAPFNIQNLGGKLYVAYAWPDAARHDDVAGPGNGFVSVFDTGGKLLQRLVSQGPLDSPWGIALAPAGFGGFGGALLVGNFGDGRINAFNPATGVWLGPLQDTSGKALEIKGLWGLAFGNDSRAGDSHSLYFTAGIAGSGRVEDHGLFGRIAPTDRP